MVEKRENRRVQMTKRLMKDALMELLEQHELVDISVTAICEAADVHRSTFYKYYKNQADLLRDMEQDYLDRIPIPSRDLDEWDEVSSSTRLRSSSITLSKTRGPSASCSANRHRATLLPG